MGGGFFAKALIWCTALAYMPLSAGGILVEVARWRTVDLLPVAVMGFWGAFSLWHLRAVSDATLLTWPLVAAGMGSPWWQRRQWPMLWGSGLAIVLTGLAGAYLVSGLARGMAEVRGRASLCRGGDQPSRPLRARVRRVSEPMAALPVSP